MWAWCVRRSRAALASRSLPKISPHSSKARLEVIIKVFVAELERCFLSVAVINQTNGKVMTLYVDTDTQEVNPINVIDDNLSGRK